MENTSFRFKPAAPCGRVFYQVRHDKTDKRAKIMALLLEIAELISKK